MMTKGSGLNQSYDCSMILEAIMLLIMIEPKMNFFPDYGSSRFQQIQNAIDQPNFLQDDFLLQVTK